MGTGLQDNERNTASSFTSIRFFQIPLKGQFFGPFREMSPEQDYPGAVMAVKQEKIFAHKMRKRSRAVVPSKATEIVHLIAPEGHHGLKLNYIRRNSHLTSTCQIPTVLGVWRGPSQVVPTLERSMV